MAWDLINTAAGYQTVTINTTGADLLVAVTSSEDPSQDVIDNKGNTWTGRTLQNRGGVIMGRIFDCRGGTVGSGHSFTVTVSYRAIAVMAFSGSGPSPFDQESGNVTPGGSPYPAGSIVTSQNDELVVAGWATGQDAAVTDVDDLYEGLQAVNAVSGVLAGVAIAYKVMSIGGVLTSPALYFTGGSTYVAGVMAAYKAGAAFKAAWSTRRSGVIGAGRI